MIGRWREKRRAQRAQREAERAAASRQALLAAAERYYYQHYAARPPKPGRGWTVEQAQAALAQARARSLERGPDRG